MSRVEKAGQLQGSASMTAKHAKEGSCEGEAPRPNRGCTKDELLALALRLPALVTNHNRLYGRSSHRTRYHCKRYLR
jgi:hypothetical protein